MSSKVTVKDNGLRKLATRLAAFKGLELTVGVHGPEGEASDGTITVAEVATINEFGLGVPERSFIRDWFDEGEQKHNQDLEKMAKAILDGKVKDGMIGLSRLGALYQAEVQARISAGIPPPNAPSTVKKKGSSKPLINTGQLRSSILWKVTKL